MKLEDIILRTNPPAPWAEGDTIPWSDPDFSRRMLAEHFSQEHDMASRRTETVDAHAEWIHAELLAAQPSRVLDLGCGPGLYLERLARRGHTLTGVDYSPASVAHARKTAERDALKVTVIEGDMRTTEFAGPYDAAMLIAGELNTLQPVEARDVVRRVVDALEPGGHFLIEVSTYESTQRGGHERQRWYGMPSGLWSDDPHMVLEESFWDEETETATARWFAVDAASGEVRRYAATYQAYTSDGYRELLSSAGLAEIRELETMGEGTADPKLTVFVASRPV